MKTKAKAPAPKKELPKEIFVALNGPPDDLWLSASETPDDVLHTADPPAEKKRAGKYRLVKIVDITRKTEVLIQNRMMGSGLL